MELVFPVVVDGDDAAANVDFRSDLAVAQIRQMRTAAVEAELGVFEFDEIANPVLTVNLAVYPQMSVRTNFNFVMNDAVGNARAVDRAVLSDHGVNQKRLRKDCRPVVDHSVAFQIDVRIQCDVFAQDDVRSAHCFKKL